MPYAANGQLSRKPLEGGIEISEEQYTDARQQVLDGKRVVVKNGELLLLTHEKRTVYSAEDGSPLTIFKDDDTPEGFVDEKPEPEPVEPKHNTMKHDIWQRTTPDEAEQLDHALSQATAKERRLFNDSTRIEHDDEYFPVLKAQMTEIVGEERALELLAPSNP